MSLHALEEEDFGPYTSPEVKAALLNPQNGSSLPLAVHFERENGQNPHSSALESYRFHARICTALLRPSSEQQNRA